MNWCRAWVFVDDFSVLDLKAAVNKRTLDWSSIILLSVVNFSLNALSKVCASVAKRTASGLPYERGAQTDACAQSSRRFRNRTISAKRPVRLGLVGCVVGSLVGHNFWFMLSFQSSLVVRRSCSFPRRAYSVRSLVDLPSRSVFGKGDFV